MNIEDIVTDEEIEEVWGNANFGSISKRDLIRHGCLKVAGGYYQGFTSNTILVELGLKKSFKVNELTQKGKEYLFWAFCDEVSV